MNGDDPWSAMPFLSPVIHIVHPLVSGLNMCNHKWIEWVFMKHWNVIAITAATLKQAEAYQHELEYRKKTGQIDKETIVLAIPDPSSIRVGSGGATLNALLTIAEHLCALSGLSALDAEVINQSKILLFHSGGDSRRIPHASISGKCFYSLPIISRYGELMTPFDLLLDQLSGWTEQVEAGLLVSSSDVILQISYPPTQWDQSGVTGLAVPAEVSYGPHHGVYRVDPANGQVTDFFQKKSIPFLREHHAVRPDETVLLDTGVVYFPPTLVDSLLSLTVIPPLDSCTYYGVDNGAIPLRFELYTDILCCMSANLQYDDFLTLSAETNDKRIATARKLLWDCIHNKPFYCQVCENGRFIHLGTTDEVLNYYYSLIQNDTSEPVAHQFHSFCQSRGLSRQSMVINSCLSGTGATLERSLIEHSDLKGNWLVESNSICSGIRSIQGIVVRKNSVLQEIQIDSNKRILIGYGIHDNPKLEYQHEQSTYFNRPWSDFFSRSSITPDDLWPDNQTHKNLWTARLFPLLESDSDIETALWLQEQEAPSEWILRQWRKSTRYSLEQTLRESDPLLECLWKQELSCRIDKLKLEEIITTDRQESIVSILDKMAIQHRADVLELLDHIAIDQSATALNRVLAAIADALAAMAGIQGGLRSGPAKNEEWQPAYRLLENGQFADSIAALASVRKKWQQSPKLLVRAARHYEGAYQILIRKAVQTVPVETTLIPATPIDTWVTVELPARIDLAGGWSDTPPICYEMGGSVVNMSVAINNQYPIKANARRIPSPEVILHIAEFDEPLVCKSLHDLHDYQQPYAPGALLKTCILCSKIVSLSSPESLEKQLEPWGGGIELQVESHLPTGSGLGTSSILSAAVLQTIGKVMGFEYDTRSLIHAVLLVEQMLTTGGGWQDQAGGLLPGIKWIQSSPSLPLQVEYEVLDLPTSFIRDFQDLACLVYTGKTRLARNLLQDVIRRWYSKEQTIVDTFHALPENAHFVRAAFEQQDLEKIGLGLQRYWNQKKQIASGAEPTFIKQVMEAISPYVFGASLTGAGGGGFMIALSKPGCKETIQEMIEHTMRLKFHSINIV